VISHLLKIQELDFVPRLQRRAFAMDNVVVPIDLRSVVEVGVPEELESVLANSRRFLANTVAFIREQLLKQSNSFRQFMVGKEERARFQRRVDFRDKIMPKLSCQQVEALA